jgi:hypothetical protein
MFARADAPIHAREQAVMFYLYARDLFALRERLDRRVGTSSPDSASVSASSTEVLPAPGGPVNTSANTRARSARGATGELQGVEHPRVGWRAAQPLLGGVQATLQTVVSAVPSAWFDVDAVDAQRR